MPVIGRLDEQVDEVLIRPASRRRGEELTRTPPHEDSKSPARDEDPARDGGGGPHPRQELPVWLL